MSPTYYRARAVYVQGFGQAKTPTGNRSNGSTLIGSKYLGVAA